MSFSLAIRHRLFEFNGKQQLDEQELDKKRLYEQRLGKSENINNVFAPERSRKKAIQVLFSKYESLLG